MKNEKEKELDINEVAIKLDVDAEVIEKVRKGHSGVSHERIKCALKKVRGGVKKEGEMFGYVADYHYLCSEK